MNRSSADSFERQLGKNENQFRDCDPRPHILRNQQMAESRADLAPLLQPCSTFYTFDPFGKWSYSRL